MKKTLKLGMLVCAMLFATSLIAQPPVPSQNGSTAVPTPTSSINRTDSVSPIGTATLLMLGMGGAFLGYKIKKNKKANIKEN